MPAEPEHRRTMPEVPDVSAIVEQVKARIKQIEQELARHERLSDELARLRDALGRLEGAARSRVSPRRRGGRDAARRADKAQSARRGRPAPAASRRAPRGQNKAKVLEALNRGPMTASEISETTGIATGTASTLLSRLAKSGEVTKADRGYKLPDQPRANN
jgi:CRP-like cAMP-binding protein